MDSNRKRYPGWAGVCSFDPATEPVEVHGDTLPDEVAAILALTPHVEETMDWATREKLAAAVADASASALEESFTWCFAEKAYTMDANGDVWA